MEARSEAIPNGGGFASPRGPRRALSGASRCGRYSVARCPGPAKAGEFGAVAELRKHEGAPLEG
eukprot:6114620-Pyramimonas_sp.AAC.1